MIMQSSPDENNNATEDEEIVFMNGSATSVSSQRTGMRTMSGIIPELSANITGYCLRWTRIEKRVQLSKSTGSAGAGASTIRTSIVPSNRSSLFRRTTGTVTATGGTESQTPTNTKYILKEVSGFAMPGEILALMGPSGSGKTSLLNVLSGRSSYQKGTISINGEIVTAGTSKMKRLKSQIAYVQQADIFFEHLTVRDQFMYTALLRLSGDGSSNNMAMIHKKVEEVLQQLRLTKVAGSAIRMCSGGEKKRINIGSEILTNPAVIILDEPTSGLDSSTAVSLMNLLSSFAKLHGKTVITSIHQPSSAVFRSFDRLLMLSEGHSVYFGTPVESITYLRIKNLDCPDGYNAADHWMDLLVNESSVDYNNNTKSDDINNDATTAPDERKPLSLSPRQILEQAWDNEAIAEQIELDNDINATIHSNASEHIISGKNYNSVSDKKISKYSTSWMVQYMILTNRAFKNSHSSIFTPLNLTKSLAMGLVSGMLWFQKDYTESAAGDIQSYYFFTMTFWTFDAMFTALTSFPSERAVILKERSSGSYHLSAYFMAKTTADAPVRWILPIIYMIVSFWMAGFAKSVLTFTTTTMCTLLSVLAGEALGLLVGASVYDLQKAITIMTVFTLFLMLLGGFWVDNVPSWLAWGKFISPFKYAFDSSLQLVFDKPMPCDGSDVLGALCSGGIGSYVPPEALLKLFGIQGSIGFNVGMLLVLSFIPRYVAYWALRRKKEGER